MMYEKEYDIFYIDPGFQEFLFAEYYTQADLEEMKPLMDSLAKLPYNKVLRFEALDMLHDRATEKFRLHVLLPFLEGIFQGTDVQAFMKFLETCFAEINICCHNALMETQVATENKVNGMMRAEVENYPTTILLDFMV